jgi:hypothetical protein
MSTSTQLVKQSFQSVLPVHFALSKHPKKKPLMRIRSEPARQQSIHQGFLPPFANRTAHSASQSAQSRAQLLPM